MNIGLLGGGDLSVLVALAFGLTYIITGSEIGLIVRALWWSIFRWKAFALLRPIVTCPPCNAFWTGALMGFLFAPLNVFVIVQVAITSCGVTALIQKILGGDGMAAPIEELEKILRE